MDNNDDMNMELVEEDSLKSKLIKKVQEKLKKPVLDDSLLKVLDEFCVINKQEFQNIGHGHLHINFAADALLIESCGQLYGKHVDLLWNDLLQMQTRILQHDSKTAKNASKEAKEAHKKEAAELQERLNRGKRKKINLVDQEGDGLPSGDKVRLCDEREADLMDLLGDQFLARDGQECPLRHEKPAPAFEPDNDLVNAWQDLRNTDIADKSRTDGSVLVAQFQKLKCNFRNSTTPTSDEMIYDLSDGDEFNTREGKLISYHHIKQLFDDNDNCLLPDEQCTIAKLRLAYEVKQKWLMKNNINPKDEVETYKQNWESYEREFFEREKRKIQNMPQGCKEDMKKLYDAMRKKEIIARQKVEQLRAEGQKDLPMISFENVIVNPVKEGYEGIFDPYVPEGYESCSVIDIDEPTAPMDSDHEAELSRLMEGLSKTPDPTASHLDNVRSDSGYFDGGFEDGESDHDEDTPSASPIVGSDTPYDFDNRCDATKETQEAVATDNAEIVQPQPIEPPIFENIETAQESQISQPREPVEESTDNVMKENEPQISQSPICEPVEESTEVEVQKERELQPQSVPIKEGGQEKNQMRKAIKSFCKLGSESKVIYKALRDSHFEINDSYTCVVYNKVQVEDVGIRLKKGQVEASGQFERKHDDERDEPQAKKRKLPAKQLAELRQGRIPPVTLKKWDKFFALNYNTELGEGEIVRDTYESDDDLFDDDDELRDNDETNNNDLEVLGLQDRSDTPLPSSMPATQDSGIGEDEHFQSCSLQKESSGIQEHSEDFELGTLDIPHLSEMEASSLTKPSFNFADMSAVEQEREDIKKRVEEWRSFMAPILKKLDGNDFDIHEYGSNIINSMDVNEEKRFDDIVAGKPPSEVVRYFVSSLQLANTSNVEISGVKKAELSNDTLRLKLLTKDRCYDHLEEYQAPSEETFIGRLHRAEEARKQGVVRKSVNPIESNSPPKRKRTYNERSPAIVAPPPLDVSKVQTSSRVDCQQPCASWQADLIDVQQNNSEIPIIEANKTPSRISIDSGFMPCDDDLFENGESTNPAFATSTPLKPRRIIRVKITKRTYFTV